VNKTQDAHTSEHENDAPFLPRGLWYILATGFILFGILYWLSRAFAIKTEKYTFMVLGGANVLIFLAILLQALIYRRQWDAMQRTVKVTEKSFRAGSRAYVFINDAWLEAPISSGAYPHPSLILRNSGKTPAYRYRVRFEQAFLTGEEDEKARRGIMPPMRPLSDRGHVLGPTEFSNLSPERKTWENSEQRENAIKGLSTYHMWGLICYVDIFNKEHAYPFSLYVRNPTLKKFSYGAYGNDIEIQKDQ